MNNKILYTAALVILSLTTFSCGDKKDKLKADLLPQISQAYKSCDWEKVINLTDSLRNNGLSYTDYIGNNGFDMIYCEALIATGKAQAAIDEINNHVRKVNPKDYYALQTIGVAYEAIGDTLKAIDAYNRSVGIKPDYGRPYLHLARIYASKNKEKSIDNYSRIIQLLGNNNMYDDVLEIGFEAWDVDSTNMIILKYMGDACFAKEDFTNAKSLYGRVVSDALSKSSAVPQVFFESDYQLALINYIEGDYAQAYSLLEIIGANEKGFEKNTSSVLFGSYVLGAAAAHQLHGEDVTKQLLDAASEIDPQAAKEQYEYFLSIVE